MLTGYPLEIALTATNSAAQAWYGYDQVSLVSTSYQYLLVLNYVDRVSLAES